MRRALTTRPCVEQGLVVYMREGVLHAVETAVDGAERVANDRAEDH